MKIVQVGATGAEAELFRTAVAAPGMPFQLEAIATIDPDLRGKTLGNTPLKGPSELDDVPFIGVVDAIDHTDAPVVFSALEDKLVGRYESRLAAGRLLVTSASVGRHSPDVPVVSVFVDGGQIDELYAREDLDGRIVDGGSSVAALIAVPLAPLDREFGIESLAITTQQGWSDAGMYRVPELISDTRTGRRDITGEGRHDELRADINRLLGVSMDTPADIDIGPVKLQHGPWVRGHHARIVARLAKDVTKKEVEELWRHFQAPSGVYDLRGPLNALNQLGGKRKWPGRYHGIMPVKLEHGDLIRSDVSPVRLDGVRPMRVAAHILEFDPKEDPRSLTFEVVGDNLVQGRIGGSLLNAAYARSQGYLG